MNILQILHRDHWRLSERLEQLRKTGPRAHASRRDLLARFRCDLERHERAERLVSFPLLKELQDSETSVAENAQNLFILMLLEELEATNPSDSDWLRKLRIFKKLLEDHIEEEEREMFSDARACISRGELLHLGERERAQRRSAGSHAGIDPRISTTAGGGAERTNGARRSSPAR